MRKNQQANRGLLTEKPSDISVVKAEERDFWHKLGHEVPIMSAPRYRQKWNDDEVRRVLRADPEKDSYQSLSEELGRSPGALRMKRSIMIALLKHEDAAVDRARLAEEDPKRYHKFYDFGHVKRILQELGYFDKAMFERFEMALHLQQPANGWRGDGTRRVLAQRRKRTDDVKRLARQLRKT